MGLFSKKTSKLTTTNSSTIPAVVNNTTGTAGMQAVIDRLSGVAENNPIWNLNLNFVVAGRLNRNERNAIRNSQNGFDYIDGATGVAMHADNLRRGQMRRLSRQQDRSTQNALIQRLLGMSTGSSLFNQYLDELGKHRWSKNVTWTPGEAKDKKDGGVTNGYTFTGFGDQTQQDRINALYNASRTNGIWSQLDFDNNGQIDSSELSRYNNSFVHNYDVNSYDFANALGLGNLVGQNGQFAWINKPIYADWNNTSRTLYRPENWLKNSNGEYYTKQGTEVLNALKLNYGLDEQTLRNIFASGNVFDNNGLNIKNLQTAIGINNADGIWGNSTGLKFDDYILRYANPGNWKLENGKWQFVAQPVASQKAGGVIKASWGIDTSALDAKYAKLDAARRAANARAAAERRAEEQRVQNETNERYQNALNKLTENAGFYSQGFKELNEPKYKEKFLSTYGLDEDFLETLSGEQKDKFNKALDSSLKRNWENYKKIKNRNTSINEWANHYGATKGDDGVYYLGENGKGQFDFRTNRAMLNGKNYKIVGMGARGVIVSDGSKKYTISGRGWVGDLYNNWFGEDFRLTPHLKNGGNIHKFENPDEPITHFEDYDDSGEKLAAIGAGTAGTAGVAGTGAYIYRQNKKALPIIQKWGANAKNFKTNGELTSPAQQGLKNENFFVRRGVKNLSKNVQKDIATAKGRNAKATTDLGKILMKRAADIAKKAAGKGVAKLSAGVLDLPATIADGLSVLYGTAPKNEYERLQLEEQRRQHMRSHVMSLSEQIEEERKRIYQQGGQLSKDEQEQMLTKATLGLIGYAKSKKQDVDFLTALLQVMQMALSDAAQLQEIANSEELTSLGALIVQQTNPEIYEAIQLPGGLTQIIQSIAQSANTQEQQITQAKMGTKLDFIKDLKGVCPEGYEKIYSFKNGGCPICLKKKLQEIDSAKCGKKMKKQAKGGISKAMDGIKADMDNNKIVKDLKPALPLKYKKTSYLPDSYHNPNSTGEDVVVEQITYPETDPRFYTTPEMRTLEVYNKYTPNGDVVPDSVLKVRPASNWINNFLGITRTQVLRPGSPNWQATINKWEADKAKANK